MRIHRIRRLAAVALAVVACGEAGGDRGDPDYPADTPGVAVDTAAQAPAPEVVEVWFSRGDSLVAVERTGAAEPRAALEALLAGPTAEERARGLSSWFGPETADALLGVRREDDRLIVDFDPSLRTAIPGASSAAGSEALLAALDSTLFQIGDVDAVEYRLGGSCEAFWGWLQRECRIVRR